MEKKYYLLQFEFADGSRFRCIERTADIVACVAAWDFSRPGGHFETGPANYTAVQISRINGRGLENEIAAGVPVYG